MLRGCGDVSTGKGGLRAPRSSLGTRLLLAEWDSW